MTLATDDAILEAVSAAGQHLIRAAAILGTLPAEDQLRLATSSELPSLLAAALKSAEQLSPEVKRSLKSHPPAGYLVPVAR